jgi:hypothetical protein
MYSLWDIEEGLIFPFASSVLVYGREQLLL